MDFDEVGVRGSRREYFTPTETPMQMPHGGRVGDVG